MTEKRENSVQKKYKVGVEAALEVMGGKWKPLIIYHLMTGRKRTSELRRLMPGITQKMLTTQLRGLEKDEIIARKVYTVGSTIEEVIAVMGTPDSYNTTSLGFGCSQVFIQNGKVSSYSDISKSLKVK
ncbi:MULTISPECIES: winged helix-turn-helix transcriptional regulator [unclassified Paenibacillus]|uniref:winged helix-turn-helix transcriptional regulator n=1 Tax=unclassified Paenibacillus TaxID=185978 RepID=UPI00362F8EE9